MFGNLKDFKKFCKCNLSTVFLFCFEKQYPSLHFLVLRSFSFYSVPFNFQPQPKTVFYNSNHHCKKNNQANCKTFILKYVQTSGAVHRCRQFALSFFLHLSAASLSGTSHLFIQSIKSSIRPLPSRIFSIAHHQWSGRLRG